MATEHNGLLDQSIPQWKRELILRRRAVGRVLPAGSGSVQLTCPSVVAAVRNPECTVNTDFHLRRIASEREETGGFSKNMRLVEQVNTSGDSDEPGVILDLKDLMTYSKKHAKMGEEKNVMKNNTDKKSNGVNLDEDQLSDSSEEFKYGPGIVSKLKSRYLSLTLRENHGKVRPSLANLRRATSLENILDEPEPEKTEEKPKYVKNVQPVNGNSIQRCRNISRGNRDSMKRARSVEALMRYDRGLATATLNRRSLDNYTKIEEEESEERKKSRNRLSSSNLEEKELPPPDVVKHTLQIFENSTKKFNTSTLPKKTENKISAKPAISPKPVLTGKIKQNGANTPPVKPQTEKIATPESPKKSPEKKSKNKITTSPVLKKESVITNSKPLNEIKPSEQDSTDGEGKSKPIICSNVIKNQMTLDLNKVNSYGVPKHKSSPTIASPKSNSDKKIEEIQVIRPISPVLVKAPPSILSAELGTNNLTNSPVQMKQVGVIRPIITNKTINSNSNNVTFPSKYPVNKPHSVLTEREIEKNLINKVKSIEQPVTKVIVSLKKSPEECIVNHVHNESNKQNDENNKKGQIVWDKKPNTMVFNFCNRKTVPDYIENDGLILTSKKEKPKRGEPGIIFLGGSTDDSSTDFDVDEFITDPPSPCDIIFEGDNILINGKSNIQLKPKQRKLKLQFNDEATTMFEYPSEASLLDDHGSFDLESELGKNSGANSPGLPNPFRCGNLASYTPSKVSMTSDFQLGVTKTPPPPPNPPPRGENTGNEEDDEYLKPADENNTIVWSSETAADLLF